MRVDERSYTTVGHVTVDVMEDGTRRAGGTALYSALQAARLGWDATLVTQGVPAELQALLAPYSSELDVTILPAPETTTLLTSRGPSEPTQRVLAWAGVMPARLQARSGIVHLAPVARELPTDWVGAAELLALTPQGLARDWSASDDRMRSVVPVGGEDLAARCQALVLSTYERPCCEGLIGAAVRAGAIVAVTDGPSSTAVLRPNREELHVPVPSLAHVVDHLGAGDVFAAAFFVALAEGRDALAAATFATAAAAVRTGGAGPGAIGQREAIEQRCSATATGSSEP
jgi:hypothetical protein